MPTNGAQSSRFTVPDRLLVAMLWLSIPAVAATGIWVGREGSIPGAIGLGVVVIASLVAGRRLANQGHPELDAGFELNFETSPIGMAILRTTGEIVAANPALETMLRVPRDQLRGRNIESYVHSDDLSDLGLAWERMGNEDEHTAAAWLHIVGRGGLTAWADMKMTLTEHLKGRPAMVVMQLETASRWHGERDQLTDTIEARDSFVQAIAGELAESLETLVHVGDTLDLPHANPMNIASEMRSKITNVASIVRDLRTSSDTNIATRLVPRDVDVLKTCVDLIAEFDLPIPIEATAKHAWADPRYTRQIISGLLTNALLYGGRAVEVRIKESGPDTLVQIVDDGPEIPERDRERIFHGDIRSGAPVTRPPSVGQRLTVARRLAEQMDGELAYVRTSDNRNLYELRLPTESISVDYDLSDVSLTSSG